MEQTNHTESVRRVVAGKIRRILEMKNDGQRKAILANLRRGAGRVPGELPELWGEFLGDLPEELYGSERGPSRAEWAVYTALTLFALHQQGHDPTQERERMNQENVGLGAAAAKIALADGGGDEALERVRRRFNIAATADSMDKLSWHLRRLVQLMSGKSIALDYARLAGDLYCYQIPSMRDKVRLEWGRDFYREYGKAASGGGKEQSGENG